MDRRDHLLPWQESNTTTRRNSTASLRLTTPPPQRMPAIPTKEPTHTNIHNAALSPSDVEKCLGRRTVDGETGEEPEIRQSAKVSWRERLRHFTWAWFTLPMSSGGIALLINEQPYQFRGLHSIGLVAYAINIAILSMTCLAISIRFVLRPSQFLQSIAHPSEGFFFPTFFLALATLITTTERYLVPDNCTRLAWLLETVFWLYLSLTLILAIAQYSYLFARHGFDLQTATPSWILPIFPVMLIGTISSTFLKTQGNLDPMPLIVSGLACQGLGFSVSIMMYAHMLGRLMQTGLPDREHRPTLFICVGPPSFTALALIGIPEHMPRTVAGVGPGPLDVGAVRTVAFMSAIFIWMLAFWWFCIAAVAVIASPPKTFHLCWWPMVFPNTGFTLSTIAIGNALDSDGIRYVSIAMTLVVVITFLAVLSFNIVAVIRHDVMFPGKDEDISPEQSKETTTSSGRL